MNSEDSSIGQNQYEELELALEALGYKKRVVVNDENKSVKGVFRLERFESEGNPTILVTIDDENDIQVWGPPQIWLNNGPDESGFGEYFGNLFKISKPDQKRANEVMDDVIDDFPPDAPGSPTA